MIRWTRLRPVGNQRLDAVAIAQPTPVKVLLHSVAGGQQQGSPRRGCLHRRGGRVGDVDQRHPHGRLHRVGLPVHGVSAQQQRLRTRGFEPSRRVDQDLNRRRPIGLRLEAGDVREVERPQQQLGRVQTAKPRACQLIEMAVVDGRAFPAHAADEAKRVQHRRPRFAARRWDCRSGSSRRHVATEIASALGEERST
jgi:hypothetical protein